MCSETNLKTIQDASSQVASAYWSTTDPDTKNTLMDLAIKLNKTLAVLVASNIEHCSEEYIQTINFLRQDIIPEVNKLKEKIDNLEKFDKSLKVALNALAHINFNNL